MESIYSILQLFTPGCWMASVDLKDAYYSVPIATESQKNLKFRYKQQLFSYTCYPNGLCICPRKCTKLMKPPLAVLHGNGHVVSGYIDDFFLANDDYNGCIRTLADTICLFDNLGFVIHPEKSVFPSQQLLFLGFLIDSVRMKVYLTKDKVIKVKQLIELALGNHEKLKIEFVAKVIGHMVSSFPAVQYGPLHYWYIEQDKIKALKFHKGNFNATMKISNKGKEDLQWWLSHIETSYGNICNLPVDITVCSDASLQGWGAAVNNTSTGDQWSQIESHNHINFLELKAAYFALKVFVSVFKSKHVRILIDNTAAVGFINNMGTSHNFQCHDMALKIWEFCISNNIWLTAAHLPGKSNIITDRESRKILSPDPEWKISPPLLAKALNQMQFEPEIDLFASRLNKQFDSFCSFKPYALYVDAFSITWSNLRIYCFPPPLAAY